MVTIIPLSAVSTEPAFHTICTLLGGVSRGAFPWTLVTINSPNPTQQGLGIQFDMILIPREESGVIYPSNFLVMPPLFIDAALPCQ